MFDVTYLTHIEGYTEWDIYNGASIPWRTSVNNVQFFTDMLDTMLLINMYYIRKVVL